MVCFWSLQAEEDEELAAIFLQKVLRGRAIQNMVSLSSVTFRCFSVKYDVLETLVQFRKMNITGKLRPTRNLKRKLAMLSHAVFPYNNKHSQNKTFWYFNLNRHKSRREIRLASLASKPL